MHKTGILCIGMYMIDVIQLPDMRSIPFSMTDSPMMHMVGTTVSGVMYFNALPTSPVKKQTHIKKNNNNNR